MRLIYVPIADSFFESSIMQEALPVRFVMLALIRLALRTGANGVVDVDPRGFAASINIPLPDVERALKRLMEPDPHSGCPDENGRRIVPVNPERPFRGWRLVNWPRYHEMVHDANAAGRMRRLREERAKGANVPNVPKVPTKTKTTGIEEKKKSGSAPRPARASRSAFVPPTLDEVRAQVGAEQLNVNAEAFIAFYESRGWKIGSAPMRSWSAALRTWHLRALERGDTPVKPRQAPDRAAADKRAAKQAEVARELKEDEAERRAAGVFP